MKITATKYRLNPDRICAGTRGSYGIEKIEFVFSPEWDGLTKKVVFHPVRGRPVEIPYAGGEIDIPPEVMRHSGETRFVVSGVLDAGDAVERKIVSLTGVIEVEHTQDDRGGNSVPITPDNFDLFMARAEERIEDKLTEAKESGEFDGPPGPAMTYDDLTDEQKDALRGEPGDSGVFVSETIDEPPPESANVHVVTEEDESEYDIPIIDGWERDGDYIWLLCEEERVGEPIQVFDGTDGKDGENFKILGYYDSLSALEAAVTSPDPGDAYGVGTAAPYNVYVFDGVSGLWVNNGSLAGVAGEDGVSPTVTIEEIEGGHRITITDANGTNIFDVMNGTNGKDGDDYVLTDTDKEDIAALVLAEMTDATEVAM